MKTSVKGQRVGAAIIDYMLVALCNFLLSLVFMFIFLPILTGGRYGAIGLTFSIGSITIYGTLASLIFYFIYYTLFPYLTKGSTIGKLIVGIKVVNLEYQKPTFMQLLIRNIFLLETLVFSLPLSLLSFFIIDPLIFLGLFVNLIKYGINLTILIMILATDDERGFHDYLAKTYVVDKNFDIDRLTKANALERSQMEWAIFDDGSLPPDEKDSTVNNQGEDTIEILNRKR